MGSRPQYGLLVSLGVVALLGVGLYFFFASLLDKLNSVNSDLSKTIIAGVLTAVGAVVTLVIGKIWEQNTRNKQEVREKKIPVYEKQIATFFAAMFAEKMGNPPTTPQDLQKAFMEFTEKLIIWGSPQVISAWSAFRLHDWSNSTTVEGFRKLEDFIRAVRADLGASNVGLPPGELVKLFVNDYPSGSA